MLEISFILIKEQVILEFKVLLCHWVFHNFDFKHLSSFGF